LDKTLKTSTNNIRAREKANITLAYKLLRNLTVPSKILLVNIRITKGKSIKTIKNLSTQETTFTAERKEELSLTEVKLDSR
jgi:hypothetical protein